MALSTDGNHTQSPSNGTNYPMITAAKVLEGLDGPGFDAEARALFLGGNAVRVFDSWRKTRLPREPEVAANICGGRRASGTALAGARALPRRKSNAIGDAAMAVHGNRRNDRIPGAESQICRAPNRLALGSYCR
jgi:hypothetical protein